MTFLWLGNAIKFSLPSLCEKLVAFPLFFPLLFRRCSVVVPSLFGRCSVEDASSLVRRRGRAMYVMSAFRYFVYVFLALEWLDEDVVSGVFLFGVCLFFFVFFMVLFAFFDFKVYFCSFNY